MRYQLELSGVHAVENARSNLRKKKEQSKKEERMMMKELKRFERKRNRGNRVL